MGSDLLIKSRKFSSPRGYKRMEVTLLSSPEILLVTGSSFVIVTYLSRWIVEAMTKVVEINICIS